MFLGVIRAFFVKILPDRSKNQSMRIYHIGLPKTGTTSLQYALQSQKNYIGTFQPRSKNKKHAAYEGLTNYLLGITDTLDVTLPEDFLYSEEMVLVNEFDGKVIENIRRLCAILRPEDKVLIGTRATKKILVSAYYELYRFLEAKPPSDVKHSCWLKPFQPGYVESIIPPNFRDQFVFSDMESSFEGFRPYIDDSVLEDYRKSKAQNVRKRVGDKIEVEYFYRPIPLTISKKLDEYLWNPISRAGLFPIRPNFFQKKVIRKKRLINPVDANELLE